MKVKINGELLMQEINNAIVRKAKGDRIKFFGKLGMDSNYHYTYCKAGKAGRGVLKKLRKLGVNVDVAIVENQ